MNNETSVMCCISSWLHRAIRYLGGNGEVEEGNSAGIFSLGKRNSDHPACWANIQQGTCSHVLSRDVFVEALLFAFSGYLFRGRIPPPGGPLNGGGKGDEWEGNLQVLSRCSMLGMWPLVSPAFLEPERTVSASSQPRRWTRIFCIGQLRQLLWENVF